MNDHGPIEIRKATVEGVDYPERQITVIAVPYDQWTPVEYRGRIIEESIAPGAFHGIEDRAGRISVNMEHDPARWVGQIRSIWSDDTGLHARIRVRRDARGTQEFDQVLDDAADGMLGASVGMAVARGDQTLTGNRRRVTRAFLDHLALTAQPAYAGAAVVDVRSVPTSKTPRLDAILAARAAASYGAGLT